MPRNESCTWRAHPSVVDPIASQLVTKKPLALFHGELDEVAAEN